MDFVRDYGVELMMNREDENSVRLFSFFTWKEQYAILFRKKGALFGISDMENQLKKQGIIDILYYSINVSESNMSQKK